MKNPLIALADYIAQQSRKNNREEEIRTLATQREHWSATDILTNTLHLNIPILDLLWVLRKFNLLTNTQWRLWGADCAEHVLPLYEATYPDNRPRRAIEAARKHALGLINNKELYDACSAAITASEETYHHSAAGAAAGSAAGSAAGAAPHAAVDAMWEAQNAVGDNAPTEQQWQINKLITLSQEHKP